MTPFGMATTGQVETIARQVYADIASDWYLADSGWVPATVRVELSDNDPYKIENVHPHFSLGRNEIVLRLGEGNLQNPTILDPPNLYDEARWSVWMAQLIHEMLHEFEKKKLTAPNTAGIALHQAYPNRGWDPPEEHGPLYYSAICDKAGYFKLSPARLLGAI